MADDKSTPAPPAGDVDVSAATKARYPSIYGEATKGGGLGAAAALDDANARLGARYQSLKEDLAREQVAPEADQKAKDRYASLEKEPGEKGGAPDGGGLALEAPEGIDAKSAEFTEFRKVAGELKLDKDKAGKMLELHQRVIAGQRKAWDGVIDGWEKSLKADPEFGGAKLEGTRRHAMLAIEELGTPELKQLVDDPIYGSNPALVRFFAAVGRRLSGRNW